MREMRRQFYQPRKWTAGMETWQVCKRSGMRSLADAPALPRCFRASAAATKGSTFTAACPPRRPTSCRSACTWCCARSSDAIRRLSMGYAVNQAYEKYTVVKLPGLVPVGQRPSRRRVRCTVSSTAHSSGSAPAAPAAGVACNRTTA